METCAFTSENWNPYQGEKNRLYKHENASILERKSYTNLLFLYSYVGLVLPKGGRGSSLHRNVLFLDERRYCFFFLLLFVVVVVVVDDELCPILH